MMSSEPRLSSPPSPPHLRSPQLQAEFLRVCQDRFGSGGDSGQSGDSAPASPASSPSPTCRDSGAARLSLGSPELLAELKESRARPLRRVATPSGLTTVFSGRGRGGLVAPSARHPPSSPRSRPIRSLHPELAAFADG